MVRKAGSDIGFDRFETDLKLREIIKSQDIKQ